MDTSRCDKLLMSTNYFALVCFDEFHLIGMTIAQSIRATLAPPLTVNLVRLATHVTSRTNILVSSSFLNFFSTSQCLAFASFPKPWPVRLLLAKSLSDPRRL